jgi:hypothetical protein
MAGAGIRTIIFDIGRVLVRVDVARARVSHSLPRNCGPLSRKTLAGAIGRKGACPRATGI